jgi:hypothetical protein
VRLLRNKIPGFNSGSIVSKSDKVPVSQRDLTIVQDDVHLSNQRRVLALILFYMLVKLFSILTISIRYAMQKKIVPRSLLAEVVNRRCRFVSSIEKARPFRRCRRRCGRGRRARGAADAGGLAGRGRERGRRRGAEAGPCRGLRPLPSSAPGARWCRASSAGARRSCRLSCLAARGESEGGGGARC